MKKALIGLVALSMFAGNVLFSCKENKKQEKFLDISEYAIPFKDSIIPKVLRVRDYSNSGFNYSKIIEENVGPYYFTDYVFSMSNKLEKVNFGVFGYENDLNGKIQSAKVDLFEVNVDEQDGHIRHIFEKGLFVDNPKARTFANELKEKGIRYKVIADSLNLK